MAFASDVADRTAHTPTDGNHDQGTVFGFTLAKTFSAALRGQYTAPFRGRSHRSGAASHSDPGRERGPHPLAPAGG